MQSKEYDDDQNDGVDVNDPCQQHRRKEEKKCIYRERMDGENGIKA
jgi:hypothetical protein